MRKSRHFYALLRKSRHFYALLVWWFLAAHAGGPTAVGPFTTSETCEVHRASRALAGQVTAPCWNQ